MLSSRVWFWALRSTSARVLSRLPARNARSDMVRSRASVALTVRIAGENRRIMNSPKVWRPSNRASRSTSIR